MDIASIPYKFQYTWSQNASGSFVTDPIPATTSAPAASQSLGFPPETAEPIAAGGTPPNINDYNGIFQYLTQWVQWQQAGAPSLYDATLQTNIGGYPASSLVMSVAYPGVVWLSLVDNNMSDPDTAGADWVQYPPHSATTLTTSGNYTVPAGVTRIYVEVWGGGGGSVGFNGASGAGGGYAAKWFNVVPGQVIAFTIGAGGIGSTTIGLATNGGTTTFSTISATGGTAGNAGTGPGGGGFGGDINISGQTGTDLDGIATVAVGGNAPRGGFGGVITAGGSTLPPTAPGGGGGVTSNSTTGENGAQGWVIVSY